MAIMAIDHGDRRIGIAVSDASETIALGLPTVETNSRGDELKKIKEIAKDREVSKIVMGLPKHMDGSEGQRARKARGFAKRLRRELPGIQIEFMDERMTSARAKRALTAEGAKNDVRKKNTDKMAAQFILNRYLKLQKNSD